ncbi:MAG: hypothetical protein ACXADO_04045 [Candidatus Thorarchaeota archaeon]
MGPIQQEAPGISRKGLSRKPYMLMLEDESGEITPVVLDTGLVSADKAIILLDEISDTTWVFIGRAVDMPTRMHALRLAKSLQKSGYKVGNTNIGMASVNLVEMLEKDDSDPEVAAAIARFKEMLTRRWRFEDRFLAYDAKSEPPEAKAAELEPAASVEPELFAPAAPAKPETPTLVATTVEPEPPALEPVKVTSESVVDQKTAFLIYSAVKNSNLVYTERFERDGKIGVKIEAPGVMVIEAIQDGDNLKIDPADFGDSDDAAKIKSEYESWVGTL